MNVGNIIDPRFEQALQRILTVQLPFAVAGKLNAIKAEVDKIKVDYDKARTDLIGKFGNKNPDGTLAINEEGNVKLEKEAMVDFSKEITAIHQKEVTLSKIAVTDIQHIAISAEELFHLQNIIKLF
jgi:hypothetical protein